MRWNWGGYLWYDGGKRGTDRSSLLSCLGLDRIGIKMIKSKAKEFFYRRYAGFNTLVVRV